MTTNPPAADDLTMTVTVRDTDAESWGHGLTRPITRTVTISAFCPQPGCGQRRGEPRGANLCEDGAYYWVQQWDNPCGHVDYYPNVLAEARHRYTSATPAPEGSDT